MNHLIEVRDLTKHFPRQSGMWGDKMSFVRAVERVSFDIAEGECLGLVGESGSGKSTTGRLMLRLIAPTSGDVRFDGQDLFRISNLEMRNLRRQMQIVFQDPYGAFNPRMTVANIIGEALELRGLRSRAERDTEIGRLLELVQMSANIGSRYPHEFSGGQRQRIGIARALAVQPRFVVLDEPVSALDVSTQAEVVNLLLDLQKRLNLTTLFISHDLSVIRVMCDRVAVMFSGRIVELAPAAGLFDNPLHPYTQELLAAVPVADPKLARRESNESKPSVGAKTGDGDETVRNEADAAKPEESAGCPYAARCPHTMEICWREMPPLVDYSAQLGEDEPHMAACHWVDDRLKNTNPVGATTASAQ